MQPEVRLGTPRAFVLNGDGSPLMPCHPARARELVRKSKARWVRYDAIQLTYNIENPGLQPVTLGVTPGSDLVGLGAVAGTESGERAVFQGEVRLRTDIRKKMDRRRVFRRSRRNRKTRYREPRFDNRRPGKCWACGRNARKGTRTCREHAGQEPPAGTVISSSWLPPSVGSRVDSTVKAAAQVAAMVPVSRIVVLDNRWDTQRLQGIPCGDGPQKGFNDVKGYVRARDGECVRCGMTGAEVHHIVRRIDGGTDRPGVLALLCGRCHREVTGSERAEAPALFGAIGGETKGYKAAAITQMGKNAAILALSGIAPVEVMAGYWAAARRDVLGLAKGKRQTALAMAWSGGDLEVPGEYRYGRCLPRGTYRRRKGERSELINEANRELMGFRKYDLVEAAMQRGPKRGEVRRGYLLELASSGRCKIGDLDGRFDRKRPVAVVLRTARLVRRAKTLIWERREAAVLPMAEAVGFLAAIL